MDTVVTITAVTEQPDAEVSALLDRAFDAFRCVEAACSRFDEASELAKLSRQVGRPVPVSPLLFEALGFACAVADLTDGAFDPTVGGRMAANGFNRHYISGERLRPPHGLGEATFRDLHLDRANQTVTLGRPLGLDLGAVAKGLAIDLAAKELASLSGFAIDAGGDLFVSGANPEGAPWQVGIRHPLHKAETICSFRITDAAICTSGSYERPSPTQPESHHLIDPTTGLSPSDLLSCTVIAPFAMMADAFATAAFVLGPTEGAALLEETDLAGLFIDPSLTIHTTSRMVRPDLCR